MSLSNIVRLKIHLGQEDDADDDLLNQLLTEVEGGILRFLRGRRLDTHTVTNEYHDGHGRKRLILRQRPVTAVADVRVDQTGYAGQHATAFAASTAWTQGVDYFANTLEENESNPGELIAIGGRDWGGGIWPEGTGNIRVTYTAGYSDMPDDVQLAVHQLVVRCREDLDKGRPVMSETLGSYSYTLLSAGDESKEMTSARAALIHYRNLAV